MENDSTKVIMQHGTNVIGCPMPPVGYKGTVVDVGHGKFGNWVEVEWKGREINTRHSAHQAFCVLMLSPESDTEKEPKQKFISFHIGLFIFFMLWCFIEIWFHGQSYNASLLFLTGMILPYLVERLTNA
jgi:hypothetical protein